MLRFFSERTGVRYPYAKCAQTAVVDFIFGGMENISATTQTAETLHDEIAALETDSTSLVAHEAAHQWWGDLLTCASWSHAWLNEGFATYWENLWQEHAHGRDELLWQLLRDRDAYLDEDRKHYRRPIVSHRYTDPIDLFDAHLYPKGGWVLHMMRGLLGDARFFAAMQHYARTNRGRSVKTADLERAVQEATGIDLSGFFDQWLYHGGHPELRVTRDWDSEQRVLVLRVEQTQTVDELTPLFTFRLPVRVTTVGETHERLIEIEHAVHELTLVLDGPPLAVRIDPELSLLLELDHERPVEESLRALEREPDAAGRIFAARELAERAPAARAVEGLAAALAGDAFYAVRQEAAAALGRLGTEAARDALLTALASDADARVRTAAASALGRFRDDEIAANGLRETLERERAYGTRAAAVRSLARTRASGAREAALAALGEASYREQVRVAALEALADLGHPADLSLVWEWTAYGKPPRARTAAIEAAARLAHEGRPREEAIERLERLLDDRWLWVRQEAMEALATLRARESIPALERAAANEIDGRVARAARRALAKLREPERPDDATRLAAEVERLERELRLQSDRLRELEKQAPTP
jgi:aminopeptidase N